MKKKNYGKCGLCLQEADLCNSHLIPNALYKMICKHDEHGGIINNFINHETIGYNDKQISKYFLCRKCEDVFSKFGEQHVIKECLCGENFPLLDKILKAPHLLEYNGERYVSPDGNKKINSNAYLYFALSIIWRNSATFWGEAVSEYRSALGPYQERIRNYLLTRDEKYLLNIYVAVYVDNSLMFYPSKVYPFVCFPVVDKCAGFHRHIFYTPGVKYSIIIGSSCCAVSKVFNKHKILFIEYSFTQSKGYERLIEFKNKVMSMGRLKKELSELNE